MRVRRRRMERHPQRQRHLSKPVISVGNLSMGGTGKTPVVAAIAQWLIGAGHRPSILSRGYGREDAVDGVVVGRWREPPVEQAGDEPLMLSRQVPGRDRVRVARSISWRRARRKTRLHGPRPRRRLSTHRAGARSRHSRDDDRGDSEWPRHSARTIAGAEDAAARAHFLVVTDATAGAASAEAWALGISQSVARDQDAR